MRSRSLLEDLWKTVGLTPARSAGFCRRACRTLTAAERMRHQQRHPGSLPVGITFGRFRRTFRLLFAPTGSCADLRRECLLLGRHAKRRL